MIALALSAFLTQAITPPANPVIFPHQRVLPAHVETFKRLLVPFHDPKNILVIGDDQAHTVASLANAGLPVHWMTKTAMDGFGKGMTAIILSGHLKQTNTLAWLASHELIDGGLLFVPEKMILLDAYLRKYHMERIGLKLKMFLEGDYFILYRKDNPTIKKRVQESA